MTLCSVPLAAIVIEVVVDKVISLVRAPVGVLDDCLNPFSERMYR